MDLWARTVKKPGKSKAATKAAACVTKPRPKKGKIGKRGFTSEAQAPSKFLLYQILFNLSSNLQRLSISLLMGKHIP